MHSHVLLGQGKQNLAAHIYISKAMCGVEEGGLPWAKGKLQCVEGVAGLCMVLGATPLELSPC